jgi:hypothetical protein
MAGFNDKNKKENIVESSKPECTQVSKLFYYYSYAHKK